MTIEPKLRGGVIFYNIKKRAFSLVELIIAIAILSILATIAFLSFWNYWSQTRDSVRRNDLWILLKSMSIYKIQKWVYPKVEQWDWVDVKDHETYEWWKETIVTEKMSSELQISKHLKDPLWIPYKYLFSVDWKYYVFEVDLENWEKLLVWNIPLSCANLKDNWQFQWTWLYNIFSDKFRPIEVFCHKDYRETFYREIIAWDMERIDLWVFPNDVNYTTEENATIWGKFSIKQKWHKHISSNHFTYVNPSEKYKLSWKIKTKNMSSNPSKVYFGFIEYDKDFKEITTERVNIIENTFTELTRDTLSSDKKIFFKCDDNIFSTLNLVVTNYFLWFWLTVAYDAKVDLSDLPSKKLSEFIWDERSQSLIDVKNSLKRISSYECSLETKNSFLEAKSWDKIRFHLHSWLLYNYIWTYDYDMSWTVWWKEFYWIINWESNFWITMDKFRKWTQFIKPIIIVNHYPRYEWWILEHSNDDSTTYIDDLKLEIIK